jgi:hypothetical protein
MATRKPTLSEMGNDRAYFKFKFIEQPNVSLVSATWKSSSGYTSGCGPAFEEAPLQSIIDCRTSVDNLALGLGT